MGITYCVDINTMKYWRPLWRRCTWCTCLCWNWRIELMWPRIESEIAHCRNCDCVTPQGVRIVCGALCRVHFIVWIFKHFRLPISRTLQREVECGGNDGGTTWLNNQVSTGAKVFSLSLFRIWENSIRFEARAVRQCCRLVVVNVWANKHVLFLPITLTVSTVAAAQQEMHYVTHKSYNNNI